MPSDARQKVPATLLVRLSLLAVIAVAILVALLTPRASLRLNAAQATSADDTPFAHEDILSWPGARSASQAWQKLAVERTAAERLSRFPDSPHTVVWLWEARRFDDALDVLERVIERRPARLPDALKGIDPDTIGIDHRVHDYKARFLTLLAEAKGKLSVLDREAAAELALLILRHEQRTTNPVESYDTGFDRILSAYAGTQAATLAEVERITRGSSPGARSSALDELAARNPGTVLAAKARHRKGFDLAYNWRHFVTAGTNSDPTDSFLELLDIVADLESGRYPPCTYVDEAPELVTGYFMYRPQISPENAERMLAGVRQFARSHLLLLWSPRWNGSMSYMVTSLMPRVGAFLPDGAAAMERQFAAFEREWPDVAAVKLLRASWLDSKMDDGGEPAALPPPSDTREADVRALLTSAATSTNELYARQALARLADREFADPASGASARAHYLEYERRFATAPDAWIAALRVAQVEQARGRVNDAVATFLRVSETYSVNGFVRALALGYAGRASEEAGDVQAAARQYQASLDAWPRELGDDEVALDPPIGSRGEVAAYDDPLYMKRALVKRSVIERRVAEIGRSLSFAGGAELERGRWLLAEGRPADARSVFEDVARLYAGDAVGAEARALTRRARLDAAVARAAAPDSAGDVAEALGDLDALAREGFDTASRMAGVVGAAIRLLLGQRDEANSRLTAALARWAEGARQRPVPPVDSLEADVLAVRDAVFLPLGSPVLGRMFRWPTTPAPFVIAPAVLRVKVDGVSRDIDVSRRPPRLSNVVFMTRDEVEYLARVVPQLAGPEPEPTFLAADQRFSGFQKIAQWWSLFFHARSGDFGVLTAPAFSSIEFTNPERTRALVPIGVGSSGATVILEKENGVWTMKELVNFWVA